MSNSRVLLNNTERALYWATNGWTPSHRELNEERSASLWSEIERVRKLYRVENPPMRRVRGRNLVRGDVFRKIGPEEKEDRIGGWLVVGAIKHFPKFPYPILITSVHPHEYAGACLAQDESVQIITGQEEADWYRISACKHCGHRARFDTFQDVWVRGYRHQGCPSCVAELSAETERKHAAARAE